MVIENGVLKEVCDNDIIDGKLIVPEGVTEIRKYAFDNCTLLKEVEFPKGLTKIGECAFICCESLESIELPEGLTEIGEEAFSDCKSLKKIKIPEGVTKIEKSAFSRCESLEEIILPESLMEIGEEAFGDCKSLKKIKIPKGVTVIRNSTFQNCKSLKNVELPEKLIGIGENAFGNCVYLEEIKIPEGVTVIKNSTFKYCESLAKIDVPESLIILGNSFSRYCKKLNVTLPKKCIRYQNVKENGCFKYSKNYDAGNINEFLEKAYWLLGLDELEKLAKMPNLTEEEMKKYSLEKEEAIQELYETKSKLTGDLGITLQILRNLKLGEKSKKISGKNNLEMQIFKYINEQLENGYDGNLSDLVKNALGENTNEEMINKIVQLEQTLNKKIITENLSKITEKLDNAISSTNEQYATAIVPAQVEPIRKMIEDTLISEFSKKRKNRKYRSSYYRKIRTRSCSIYKTECKSNCKFCIRFF